MADLIQVRLEDFRAFRQATLDLGPSGLMLAAGPNNVGKSALLSAFDVIAGLDLPDLSQHAAGERVRICARWSLSDDERKLLIGETDNTLNLLRSGAASWLEWEFAELTGRIQPVMISIGWSNAERRQIARVGPVDAQERSWGFSANFEHLAIGNYRSGSRVGGNGDPVADTLPIFVEEDLFDLVKILRDWRTSYFHFKPLREAYGREAQLIDIAPTLQSSGANLATVLLYVHNNLPEVWHRLTALVQQIVPGVGQLMTPVDRSFCRIVFQDETVDGHQHNLKDLGTGVEQILMTLVVGLTQAATTVILEEPETGLHPGAQRALLGLLQDWSAERLFIASTHSATMLDWMSPTTSVLSVSRVGIESTVAPVTTERASVLRELGVRLSDVLSAERILILEGATDKDIFDVWFPEVARNPRVVVVDGGGGYNARHADLFVQWLADTDQLGARRVLYARDADELSTKFLEKLDASPYVYVLPCRELENLLIDFIAITEVLNAERSSKQSAITREDVASTTRKLADELRPTVVLKRVMADLAEPIRLVDHKLRQQLSKAKAGKDELLVAVLQRVPERGALEATITETWQSHSHKVDEAWEKDWWRLAPGADILTGLWKKYLNRGYSKSKDGVAIARKMSGAPKDLWFVLQEFMGEEGGKA